jgi:hypothetical protein
MLWLALFNHINGVKMSMKYNPSFNLTPEQGRELWKSWESIRELVDSSKDTLVAMKLSRQNPVLTRRQLFMICATLANLGYLDIPEWAHKMLDKQPEAK